MSEYNTASESTLGDLHVIVAGALKTRIQNEEICTAADINAAIKFLKDNNITASREANRHLQELQEELEKTTSNGITIADEKELQAALDNVMQFPGGIRA